MIEAKERLLYEHLGGSALAFLLASDVEMLDKRFNDTERVNLDARREGVLSALIIIDDEMVNLPHESLRVHEWVSRLAIHTEPTAPAMGNLLRQMSGGEISLTPVGLNSLETTLASLTIDVYPGLLVKQPDNLFQNTGLTISLYRHPLNEKFQALILEDLELVALFTDGWDHGERGGTTLRSTGRGGTHQLSMFVDTLITAGWNAALLESVSPSSDAAVQAVLDALQTVRASLTGKEAFVPVRVGLAGVLFPEGCNELDLGWAVIRKADERDVHPVRFTSLKGQMHTATSDGNMITINYSGDLVIEFNVPYMVRIGEGHLGMVWPEELIVGPQLVEELIQNIRLGLLLGCPDLRPILVTTWQVIVDPLSQGSVISWLDVSRTPGLKPILLTEEQMGEWSEWAMKVHKNRIASIGVAIRRMLMSIAERYSPEDVLVDAVIVWENLFGTKSETTLRISSSLAWLLGESEKDRLDRQARYKEIYGIRSSVVHGSAKVDASKLQKESKEAIQVSIYALRAVFGQRSELLKFRTSEERSLHVLHAG